MFRYKKCQIAVTDLFIALVVATILIIVVVFTWNRYAFILGDDADYKEMQLIAFQAADLLVKSKGEPQDWEENPTSVDVIGLAGTDRNVSVEKVSKFINLSYNITKNSLGLGFYDFYFQLKNINGTKLMEHGSSPSNTVINVQRIVSYQNEKAIVELALWK